MYGSSSSQGVVIMSKQALEWTTQADSPMSFPKPDERVKAARSTAKPVTEERAYLPLLHDIIYRHISHLQGGSAPKGGLPRPRSTAEQSREGLTGAQPIATCCSRDGIRLSGFAKENQVALLFPEEVVRRPSGPSGPQANCMRRDHPWFSRHRHYYGHPSRNRLLEPREKMQ